MQEKAQEKKQADNELQVISVDCTREYAEGLAADNRSILWHAFDLTRRRYWQPIAHHYIYVSDHCQCSPLSDCTWYVCVDISNGMKSEESNWFCGWCGHINTWREGRQILTGPNGLKWCCTGFW